MFHQTLKVGQDFSFAGVVNLQIKDHFSFSLYCFHILFLHYNIYIDLVPLKIKSIYFSFFYFCQKIKRNFLKLYINQYQTQENSKWTCIIHQWRVSKIALYYFSIIIDSWLTHIINFYIKIYYIYIYSQVLFLFVSIKESPLSLKIGQSLSFLFSCFKANFVTIKMIKTNLPSLSL